MYLADEHKIWVCKGEDKICMLPKMANRHGLIAGATGTGKTVTLKVLAESFSEMGVPVFLADIKGDVSGMCKAGESSEGFQKRLHKLGIENFEFKGFPVRFFDVFGKKGHPVRTTISEMGPDLLSRLLELNTTQSGIMTIIFKIADDQGLLLLDLKDLRSMVQYVGDNAAQNCLWQCVGSECRRDPAGSAAPGRTGRRCVFRRAGTGHQGLAGSSR
jgi:DNA helicase HerA-like ATPase